MSVPYAPKYELNEYYSRKRHWIEYRAEFWVNDPNKIFMSGRRVKVPLSDFIANNPHRFRVMRLKIAVEGCFLADNGNIIRRFPKKYAYLKKLKREEYA